MKLEIKTNEWFKAANWPFFFCEGDDYEAAIFRMFSKTLMLHNLIKSVIEFTIPGWMAFRFQSK